MCCVSDNPHQSIQPVLTIFGVSITATKISILCLYHRLFPTVLLRRATVLLGVICILWLIAFEVVISLNCISFSSVNIKGFFFAVSIAETILDFAVLCLPLRVVSSLQISPRQKMGLYMTFLVGGL